MIQKKQRSGNADDGYRSRLQRLIRPPAIYLRHPPAELHTFLKNRKTENLNERAGNWQNLNAIYWPHVNRGFRGTFPGDDPR